MKQELYKYTEVRLVKYKKQRKPEKYFFSAVFFRLIADTIVRNINITIFVYVPAQRFKGMFYFEIA